MPLDLPTGMFVVYSRRSPSLLSVGILRGESIIIAAGMTYSIVPSEGEYKCVGPVIDGHKRRFNNELNERGRIPMSRTSYFLRRAWIPQLLPSQQITE